MTPTQATTVRPGSEAGIQAVVFDLGGVLLDWNPRYLYRSNFWRRSVTRLGTPSRMPDALGTKRSLRQLRRIRSTPL
jgi:hypothetical protein